MITVLSKLKANRTLRRLAAAGSIAACGLSTLAYAIWQLPALLSLSVICWGMMFLGLYLSLRIRLGNVINTAERHFQQGGERVDLLRHLAVRQAEDLQQMQLRIYRDVSGALAAIRVDIKKQAEHAEQMQSSIIENVASTQAGVRSDLEGRIEDLRQTHSGVFEAFAVAQSAIRTDIKGQAADLQEMHRRICDDIDEVRSALRLDVERNAEDIQQMQLRVYREINSALSVVRLDFQKNTSALVVVQEIATSVHNATQDVMARMQGVAKEVTSSVDGVAKEVKTTLHVVAEGVTTSVQGIGAEVVACAQGAAKDVATTMGGVSKEIITSFEAAAKNVATSVHGAATELTAKVTSEAESNAQRGQALMTHVDVAMSNLEQQGDAARQQCDGILRQLHELKSGTAEVTRSLGDYKRVRKVTQEGMQWMKTEVVQEVESLLRLYRLGQDHDGAPLLGGWAMDPAGMLGTLHLIDEADPEVIVEFGSGTSTLWIAEHLRHRGKGRLISIDHLKEYAEGTRINLIERGLSGVAEVRLAPLKDIEINGRSFHWYDTDQFADLKSIDFLLIDGPPTATGPLARYPALPLMAGRLRDGACILLDDATRKDEKDAIALWLSEGNALDPVKSLGGRVSAFTFRQQPV